jgi:AraC-like DNA-binding protein
MTKAAKSSSKQEIETIRLKLEEIIMDFTKKTTSLQTDIPFLNMASINTPLEPMALIYEPSLCICVRGQKNLTLGDEVLVYDQAHYLLTCISFPTPVSIPKASLKNPYAALQVKIDLEVARSVMAEMEMPATPIKPADSAVDIRPLDLALIESVYRLAKLSQNKKDIPVLAPLLQREILYRLLEGPSGDRLREIVQLGSQTNRVSKAVNWLRENYKKKVSIDELAKVAAMGVSTFHRHFQDLTTMSPIQYQKQLRLHEARRLMVFDGVDVSSAAVDVGYESVTQFGREYKRLFGVSPGMDKKQIIESNLPQNDVVV